MSHQLRNEQTGLEEVVEGRKDGLEEGVVDCE